MDHYEIQVSEGVVTIKLSETFSNIARVEFLDTFRRRVPERARWSLVLNLSSQKNLSAEEKELIQGILKFSMGREVHKVIIIAKSVTLSVQIKRIARQFDMLEQVIFVEFESDVEELLPQQDLNTGSARKTPAVTHAPVAAAPRSGKAYQITANNNGIHFEFMDQISEEDARDFVDDFRRNLPKSDRWYVMADVRKVKVVSQQISRILQEATELAQANGRQFSVQIVDSPTARLQLNRVARERGQADRFFVVMSKEEAEEVIEREKSRFGIH